MEQKFENIEKSGREKLKELEAEEEYVFHGSGTRIETLEPRQAHNYPNNNMEDRLPDGEPAVFASDIADIAIFMAVISKDNAPKGLRSGFGIGKHGPQFRATKETMEQIRDAKGYVYVFKKKDFRQRDEGPNEWISNKPIKPLEVIGVSERDLPENIEIKDF